MPEIPSPGLRLVADLVIEVGDERGSTTARLSGDETGLVLDVRDPATLARCVPRQARPGALLGPVRTGQLAGLPVRVTSRGQDLARVRMTRTGRLDVRPTLTGCRALVTAATAHRRGRIIVTAGAVVAVGALVHLARRRHGGS